MGALKDAIYVDGMDGGQDDTVPALLASGEFVIPADVVAHLGDGNPDRGSEILEDFISRVRAHKTQNGRGHPPKSKGLNKYLAEAEA